MGSLRISNAGLRCAPWVLASALGSFAVLGCTGAIGLGVGAAMIGGAALSAGCYDPVDVTVLDGVTGLRACDARVVARSSDGAEAAFASCFHAELPVGTWTVRAERLGYQPVTTVLLVRKADSCEPALQSIELSVHPLGVAPPPAVAVRPPRSDEAPLTPGALPAPASLGAEQGGEQVAPPAASPPAPAAPPTSSSGATPVPPAPAAASSSAPIPPAPPAPGAFPTTPPAGSAQPGP